jgi:hypothetical protein
MALACTRFNGAFYFDTNSTGAGGAPTGIGGAPGASGNRDGAGIAGAGNESVTSDASSYDVSPAYGEDAHSATDGLLPMSVEATEAPLSGGDSKDGNATPTDGLEAPGTSPCSDVTCPFSGSSCVSLCNLSCPENQTCIGSCGSQCSATCAVGSSCTLVAGNHGIVTCEGSICRITIGETGSVTCQNGATCDVICTDNCNVSCSASSHCTLKCPGKPNPITVSGMSVCASD